MEHERAAFGGLVVHQIWMALAAATSQNASEMLCQLRHDEVMMDTRGDLGLQRPGGACEEDASGGGMLLMKSRRRSHRRTGTLPSHNPELLLIILSCVWHQQIISETANKQEAPPGGQASWERG